MIFRDTHSHYEILELTEEATPQEIKEAYQRLKSIYSKDSLAFYSLMERTSTNDILEWIEEAYSTLSSPEKRREYDRNYLAALVEPKATSPMPRVTPPESRTEQPQVVAEIFSIDRVPPMESHADPESLLLSPSTDFQGSWNENPPTSSPFSPEPKPESTFTESPFSEKPSSNPTTYVAPLSRRGIDNPLELGMQEKIRYETEWRGDFLRAIREAHGITLEELSNFTKITKRYLQSIEDEKFDTFHASVFLRGFLLQIARKLRLPAEQVANAYIARYKKARPDRT